MKILLTSNGLVNASIVAALQELVGKPFAETNLAFIPTAINPEETDKSWVIRDLVNIQKQGFKLLDIVDISAMPMEWWLPRLEHADVLFFSGGHSPHLMHWLQKSGLAERLPELLKTRVYVGISAGSIVACPSLALSNGNKRLSYEEKTGYNNMDALHLVDFHVRPHLNAGKRLHTRAEAIKEVAKSLSEVVYGLDDQSALKVVDGNVEIVSEGETLVLNQDENLRSRQCVIKPNL